MLRNALSCFSAQLELSHLAGTVPVDIEYEELASTMEQRMQNASGTTPGVFELLEGKEIHLPVPDDPVYAVAALSEPLTIFLCDIEGTTTPLPFIREVMMPRILARVDAYVETHFPADSAFVELLVNASNPQSSPAAKTPTAGAQAFADAVTASKAHDWKNDAANAAVRREFGLFFRDEVKNGSADSAVKAIQAVLMAEIFAEGEIQSQVFADVNAFFRYVGSPAMAERTRIALYSTGSIAAQKLIMQHTPYGDLNPFVTAYFDPALVGTKLMPKSYMKIRTLLAQQLDISPDSMHIVFVTDNTSEASAAETSGAVESSILCIRPMNSWVTFDTLLSINVPHIVSFAQLTQRDCEVDLAHLVSDGRACMKE
ncbi:Haloacid dehalogenase-like hydrolase [Novymonas esmeraldas]|uniref:Haloacid dehalogenase-like hydrolase n=1 Tax=Novymonas esmeraldas TaxID=1808958 RepID=A0AAW0FB03_9TRYP